MIGNIRHTCFRMATIRYFNNSSLNRLKYTPRENPGVYRRIKAISEDEPDVQNAGIDYDSLEDLEQDFMEADVMHDEITDHMKNISKAQQFYITERRHFRKPKEPSMLSWSEKEQIRHLHQSDAEKWTADRLAESFPASPTIIKRILKWKWKPSSAERLRAHDQKVSENWKAFHKGQLEIHDLKLSAHLAKFTDRKDGIKSISDEGAAKITELIMPKPNRTEFLSIITSLKTETDESKIQQASIQKYSPNSRQIPSTNQLNMLPNSKTNYTLEQYSRRLEEELSKLTDSTPDVNAIINTRKQAVNSNPSELYVAPSETFKPNAVVFQISKKSPLKLRDPDNLPHKIQIPKEVWKQGLVYKVNDCFYNDEGYFLYRVPGLKS